MRSAATTSFAILQAVAPYGLSFLFVTSGGSYTLLFGLGATAMVLALIVDLTVTRGASRASDR